MYGATDYTNERLADFAPFDCGECDGVGVHALSCKWHPQWASQAPAARRTRKPVDPTAPTLDSIRTLLDTRQDAVERAISLLYARQTADEQASAMTVEHNGMGFNGADAELLSSFAQQIARGRHLSPRQMEFARKKVRKYARQILEVALVKHAAKAAKGAA